ncbi:glutaredoxin [Pluteus cervinus]|uniref:Glutaredoxin n=1 Tax=Pluteus cervinus TaxID=181527 RepID=A0ACD3ACM2_9AGAR|nr:glutaredoxin [Pluteus cervinus]
MSETTNNLHTIHSSSQFQELLSADLDRLSLINFWAPWAAPCTQMNDVVSELAKKHPSLLALQVEAEDQEEITESFNIEAVPSFLILRGHTLLERIEGADAVRLTQAVTKHTSAAPYKPLSHSDARPAKPGNVDSRDEEKTETEEQLNTRLRALMNQSKVVLFMKGSPDAPRCGFSRKIVGLLQEQKVPFAHFDILTDESVRQGLKTLNDWPTFPQLIIKGELVGGLDIAQEMVDNGEFKELVD